MHSSPPCRRLKGGGAGRLRAAGRVAAGVRRGGDGGAALIPAGSGAAVVCGTPFPPHPTCGYRKFCRPPASAAAPQAQ